MKKSPFYFADNQIPLELKDVKFLQHKFNDSFVIPYTEGYLNESEVYEFIPTFEDKVFDLYFCLNDLLSNSYNNVDSDSAIVQLSLLSQLFLVGSVFLYKKNEAKVFSTPVSMEMHYFIEEKIAAIDSYDSRHTQMIVAQSNFNVATMIGTKDFFQAEDFLDKDETDVVNYYNQAAQLYHPGALHVLGILHHRAGKLEKSYEYFVSAAMNGNVDSQFNLMAHHLNGEIAEKNIGKAYVWGMIASNNKDQKAKEIIEKDILPKLSPESIENWNKLISTFEENPESFYKEIV